MKTNIITIVAAIIDKTALTLYKEDGTTVVIQQGDPRVRKIIDEVMPSLIANGKADVDIASPDAENHYAEFEKKTNGLVRFFRVTKEKVAKFFTPEPSKEDEVAQATVVAASANTAVVAAQANVLSAINEILDQAVPASADHFNEEGLYKQTDIVTDTKDGTTSGKHPEDKAEDTMIAVVGNQVIPGVEKIKNQFARAQTMGSPEGVKRFLERIGSVIDKRKHSVEDLLKFMERADLPIADDGSIVIYKILSKKGDVLVDCHSQKIEQWVGAYVHMAENMVDHNRRNECSNGLHIARRGYLGSFSGDVCTMCKLAPEDVIAVPEYDANKMRVCGYHILNVLPPELFRLLKNNQPMTSNPEGAKLLAEVLRGNHTGITHRIEIINNGTKETTVSAMQVPVMTEPVFIEEAAPVVALADTHVLVDAPIDPTAVNKTFVKMSRREEAVKLMGDYYHNPTEKNYQALLNLKKTAKVSWEKLGLNEPLTVEQMLIKQKKAPKQPVVESKSKDGRPLASNRDQVLGLLPVSTVEDALTVLEIKRRCKKSWLDLGVSEANKEAIMELVSQGK